MPRDAACFTKGDSIETTRKVTSAHPPKSTVRSTNRSGMSTRNTMTGMPGYINAHPSSHIDGAKGGKGSGPHREGDVGKHTGRTVERQDEPGKRGTGTMSKNAIHGKHHGHEGGIKSNLKDGSHHLHTGSRGGSAHTGDRAPPTAHGKIPGGMGTSHSAHFGTGVGQRGKMESLRGRAKTSYEGGRKKSMMY